MPATLETPSEHLPALTPAERDNLKYRGITPPPRRPSNPSSGENAGIQSINEAVQAASTWVRPLEQEIGRVIVGQKYLVDRLLVGLIANGHLLLEGVPGLAKTLSLRTLAAAIDTRFQRIQFTPDMLPADIVGTQIYNPRDGSFNTKHGPIFANLILADEINRAPAKVQSALLEAMQERQVTLGSETYTLPEPFLVLATQNPVEQEGTYPLPEAQVDRFMMKLVIGYPNRTEELAIQDAMATTEPNLAVQPVVTGEEIMQARRVANSIFIDQKVREYIVDLVLATRDPKAYGLDLGGYVQYGASPACDDQSDARRQGRRVPRGPRLRHPAGREGPRARCAAPPHQRFLRGGGGERDCRRHRQKHPRHRARAVNPTMNPQHAKEILKKVRQVEIRTRRLVNDSMAGQYHSVFKGRGMDFDEVREYVPGDEVRMIDWNVTARAGHPLHQEVHRGARTDHPPDGRRERVGQTSAQRHRANAKWPRSLRVCWHSRPSATATRWG